MTLPPLGFRRTTGRAYRHPLVWLGRELAVNAQTGQTGTFTRAATAAPTDSYSTARTVVHSQPAWQTSTTHSRTGLLMGTNANLAWSLPLIPQAMCGMVEFVENGGVAVANGGVFYLGNDAATGARLYIQSSGSQYRLVHNNGSAAVTATMTGTAPTTGQLVRLRWWLYSTGSVQIWQSINGAAETGPAATSTNALAAAWAATTCRLNSIGTSNAGNNIYGGAVVMLGNQTAATLLAALT